MIRLSIISLLTLALVSMTTTETLAQCYYFQYSVKPIDSTASYEDEDTALTYRRPASVPYRTYDDIQTFSRDHFFYHNKMRFWSFRDSLLERITSGPDTGGNYPKVVTYSDSNVGNNGISGKVPFQSIWGDPKIKSYHATITYSSAGAKQFFLFDKKQKKLMTVFPQDSTWQGRCRTISTTPLKETTLHEKIKQWNCTAWVPKVEHSPKHKILIWVSKEIPKGVEVTDFGNNLPGGVARVEVIGPNRSGYYYQLDTFRKVNYSDIKFVRAFSCTSRIGDPFDFVLNATTEKRGIKFKVVRKSNKKF